jgi:hypothetical protein
LAYRFQRLFIADNVFMIIALPETAVKWLPFIGLHASDIAIRCNRFIGPNNFA